MAYNYHMAVTTTAQVPGNGYGNSLAVTSKTGISSNRSYVVLVGYWPTASPAATRTLTIFSLKLSAPGGTQAIDSAAFTVPLAANLFAGQFKNLASLVVLPAAAATLTGTEVKQLGFAAQVDNADAVGRLVFHFRDATG